MKKNYFLLLFLLSSLITFSLNAQTPPQWKSYFRGIGDNEDRFHKIIPDGAGNLICVGYTVKSGNHKDILTAKIKTNGDTLWWKTKNGKGNGDDVGKSVGVDASGNVYVVGTVDGGNSQNDIMVIKYDANGVVQWDTTWNNPVAFFDDVAVDIKVDAAGNSYVGGNTEPDTFAGSSDWVTMKFATDGSLQWVDIFTGTVGVSHGKDELAAMYIDVSANVYVTGRTQGPSNDNIYTIKYDGSNGSRLWQAPYNGGANDRGESICVDNLGYTYVTGRDDNGSSYDIRTIKYDNNNSGGIRWTRLFDSAVGEDDKPVKIVVDNNYNAIIAGYTDFDGSAAVDNDFLILKYDSVGTIPPLSLHVGSPYGKDDEPSDVVVDNSGNIYVTGRADENPQLGSTDYDIMTVKYNASFGAQWNGPVFHSGTFVGGDDYGMSLVFYNDSVYVAGGTRNNGTQKDATVIKYDIATGNEFWYRDYNGNGDFSESARSIVVDGSNNSYVTGYTYGEGENLNGFISKIDPSGTLLCTIIYNGIKNDDDELNQIAISGNNVYACGYTKVTGQKSNMLLIKYDVSICDTAWTRTYDYIGQSDKAESLVVDGNGDIYVTGRSDSDPNDTLNNEDIITIKYTSSGGIGWVSPIRYDGTSHLKDEPVKIILDNTGHVIVGGRTENVHDDILILKYQTSDGSTVAGFPVIYDSQFTNDDRLNDITVDANNNIFVAGYVQTGPSPSTDDPIVMSYDPNGIQTGFNSYSGNGHDEASRVIIDASGDVFALYKYDTQPTLATNSYSLLLKKYDNLLSQDLWPPGTAQYNSPINNDVVPADLKLDSHGNVFAVGTVDNNINGGGAVNRNWITLGYSTSGNNIFASNEDGPDTTDDSPNALIISGDNMWVCGYTGGTGNNQKDATVYNYSILGVGIKTPALVSSSAYPNPFMNECVISVSDAISSKNLVLSVYDMIGNLVTTPIQFSGNNVHLQKGKLSSGFYEYKITNDGNSIARGKLVVE